ncbi:two-component system response regulator NarL [Thiohalorhabdus methylotrophus]|uniref:Two-component system response regulator NarL n=1 Tax=Thiohalorhabdus methylotrophus TaxID=3242694 RepID=A0ABV4TXB3_9GAMM
MTEDTHRILLIDDHPLFLSGLSQLIDGEPGFSVVGEASSGREGMDKVEEIQPDLVLLDLNMKEITGLEVLKSLKQKHPDILVVMLTVSDSEDDLVTAIRWGADGYLLKDMEPEDLVGKLHNVSSGQVILTDHLTELLTCSLRNDREKDRAVPDDSTLTERERQILALIAEGLSNKLIARELEISDGTVKVHVRHLLSKLNLRSRLEAAVWFLEQKAQT